MRHARSPTIMLCFIFELFQGSEAYLHHRGDLFFINIVNKRFLIDICRHYDLEVALTRDEFFTLTFVHFDWRNVYHSGAFPSRS